jgi:peptide/nickel transport system permease protein
MQHRASKWRAIIDQIFDGFIPVDNATPDWLAVPGTGRRLSVDVLYPELGIAFWLRDSSDDLQKDEAVRGGMRAALCRQAGIILVVVDGEPNAQSPTLAEICTALSAVARRVAHQRGAREAKLALLPRIASAKAKCQQIHDEHFTPPSESVQSRWPQQQQQTQSAWQQQAVPRLAQDRLVPTRSHLANLGTILASILGILKHIALFIVVLLAVNGLSYLVANFLDLRGPMAYNYAPDTKVPLADVAAPYPEYLWNALHGDFGMMHQNELRGMLFSQQEIPIIGLVLQRISRSLVLLGLAMLFAIVVGLTAGFISVNYRTHRTNPLALVFSLAGFSMPGFYMAILVLYLMIWMAMRYGKGAFFFPTTGFGLDKHLILPVLALAARPTAEIARLTAELLVEELPKDYIRVARAKGLTEQWIVTRHAFRNVVSAVINAMSNSWSYVIGSLVIIERVFAWGGIGEALLDSVTFSQFAGSSFNPALVATLATALALLFLLADLITGSIAKAVDPRLRRARGGAA